MKRYVSNGDESARMFQSDILEFFSHVHPSIPAIIYLPVIGYMSYEALGSGIGVSYAIPLLVLGLVVWSYTEYVLHRFIFHFIPKSEWGKQIHFMFHGVHHDYPNDSTRLVMPPVVSIPLALFFYFLFRNLLGAHYVPPFFAGFILGYLSYDLTHYAVHHFRLHGRISLYLKQHHMRHHYMDPDGNYGVSSPMWDFVFGTYMSKQQQESAATKTAQP
jgi:sterol desaturase/sphingolipid hydroxylase (fatty acid hydroxylase superfamily)